MHVHIHLDRHRADQNRLELDGVDITNDVLAEGFAVRFAEVPGVAMTVPYVELTLKPASVSVSGDLVIQPGQTMVEALVEGGWTPPAPAPSNATSEGTA